MNLSFAARLLAASLALAQAQSRVPAVAATPSQLAAGTDHWCGPWAGAPNPSNIPFGQQLPPNDFVRHFFVEPQLQKVPFSPVLAKEPKVQIPKIWGNSESSHEVRRNSRLRLFLQDDFRIALLSYATAEPTTRIYSSSKSRWADFHEALGKLMSECVSKGSGGAWLVPRMS